MMSHHYVSHAHVLHILLLNVTVGFTYRSQVHPHSQAHQDMELKVMNRYMEMLNRTLSSNTYLQTAYLAFQTEVINKSALENILIPSGPHENLAQTTVDAIQNGISERPLLFHKFVHLLQIMDKKEMADKLQIDYGKLILPPYLAARHLLSLLFCLMLFFNVQCKR